MDKTEIRGRLDAAGIEYDARLGVARLLELLPESPPEVTPASPESHSGVAPLADFVVVKRSFWMDGVRHERGAVVRLPADADYPGVRRADL